MTNQLYRNGGNGRFEDVSSRAGQAFTVEDVGRGAAFGDLDNDGDTDVVVGTAAGPARLLVNNIGHRNHWVGLRLVGPGGRGGPPGGGVGGREGGGGEWRVGGGARGTPPTRGAGAPLRSSLGAAR